MKRVFLSLLFHKYADLGVGEPLSPRGILWLNVINRKSTHPCLLTAVFAEKLWSNSTLRWSFSFSHVALRSGEVGIRKPLLWTGPPLWHT